ncbi:DUF1631 family protein [Thermomonas sp.]|jgi:hypothetical protein|uniref:DUF1631 family protein n=1 Tax=Thermomonas sp. TaxID=1971895 RepID=UPI002C2C8322|nr:DUF1631 family protein [Thermomonas sp.]
MAAAPAPQGSTTARTLALAELPRRVRLVLEHVLQEIRSDMGRQLQTVLLETELALSRQGSPVNDPKVEAAKFVSLNNLRVGQQRFTHRFLADIEAGLAGLHEQRRNRRLEEQQETGQGLTLLDDEAMSDQAMLNNIASRIESRNSLALQLMGQRFGVLAGAPAFDGEHLPIGPYALCQALHDASSELEFPPHAKFELYRQFEKVLMALYSTLLEALNNKLASDGILPHLSFVPVRARPASGGSGSPRTTTTMPALGAGDGGPAPASKGAAAIDLPSALTMEGKGRANFMPAGTQAVPQAPHPVQGSQAAQGPASVAPPKPGGLGAGFAALQNLLKRRRVLLAKLRPGGQDERVREPLRRDEVLGALQRMRANATKADTIGDFRQILLAQARQMHGHGVALADSDSDTFELLALFLAQLQREMRKGSDGEVLVERLRLPMLQLALRDHRFFVDPSHPGRMLLDAVSRGGARWLAEDDVDLQWLGLLQRAVATVQQDAEGAFDTFVEANQTLQSGLQALARKTEMAERRQVEAARGREKLEVAKQRANSEIARLLGGRSLPRFHAILMDQAWADVLSLTHLRNGEQSAAWRDLIDTTAAIIDASTSSGQPHADPAFVARVQGALEQVGYHADDATAIARQLANGRAEDADLASRTELLVQLRARARLGEGNVAAPGTDLPTRDAAEEAAFRQLRALQEPTWVEFDEDADEAIVRRRLAWTSQHTHQTLVVNRRGMRTLSEDLDVLARKLAAGKLRVLEVDAGPAEAAWEATMASLQRIAESEGQQAREDGHGD